MAESTDAQLLELVKKGDAKAMDVLLARHENKIYRFGLRMCGNEDDARDVLQETLLAAFKNLGTFRGDSQLSTWLYQVARSFCIKQRRRREGRARPPRVDGGQRGEGDGRRLHPRSTRRRTPARSATSSRRR